MTYQRKKKGKEQVLAEMGPKGILHPLLVEMSPGAISKGKKMKIPQRVKH